MIVLGLDTAGASCGVAIGDGDRILARRLEGMARGQAEALVPLVEACLAEAGIAARRIGLIGVTVGPGAFTGLRLGLAAAGGYALALGCPIVGVTTLAAHAAAVVDTDADAGGGAIVAAVDSRRADPFVQVFQPVGPADADGIAPPPRPLGPAICCAAADLAAGLASAGLASAGRADDAAAARPVRVAGDAAAAVARALAAAGRAARIVDGTRLVDPAVVVRLAAARAGDARPDPPPPVYLRPPDAVPAPPARAIRP